jgi:fructose-1,6-bisphosphatase/inositol monophosphatase family enzyme
MDSTKRLTDNTSEQVGLLLRQTAADIVLPRFRTLQAHEQWQKSPGEIVTIVDHEAEALIASDLAAMIPGSRVVGEEAAAHDARLLERLSEGAVWLVDPLDGTANFAAGNERFAMMVALLLDGEAVASWMLDPMSSALAHAETGSGAFINATRIRSSAEAPILGLMRGALLTGFLPAVLYDLVRPGCAQFQEVLPGMRCAGHEYPAIARGFQHFALFWRTLPWDHVPGALFLTEAGGRAARLDGRAYRADQLGSGLLLAHNALIWQVVRDCLLENVPAEMLESLCRES